MSGGRTLPEENVIIVVVQAEREISKTALSWALSHLVRPGDFVTLLTVIPRHAKAKRKKLWGIPKFAGECVSGQGRRSPDRRRKEELSLWRFLTAVQLHEKSLDPEKVNVRIKVVGASQPSNCSAVVAECRRIGATWIVLDRELKDEAKNCMREIQDCSIVLMERNEAKVLRLNLRSQHAINEDNERGHDDNDEDDDHGCMTHPTPASSPEKERVLHADLRRTSSISAPPPLCAECRHRAPQFGKPPKFFPFWELEEATSSFCERNLLGKSEMFSLHRGVLRNGQMVAVKRMVAQDGDEDEFRAEVDTFSRAQQRNVVMLVAALDWPARLRIAVGVARGLRYIHEDCRVGFIHGDVRPSNILLTHEFHPLISGFGFSRWKAAETIRDRRTRFGYLAPEILEKESLTEKTDVYAFGVVLSELLTGRKAIDKERPKGHQFLAEWARPAFQSLVNGGGEVDRLLDPLVDRDHTRSYSHQINALYHAAAACLQRDPKTRPTMTKVLRMMEEAESAELGISTDQRVNDNRGFVGQPPRRSLSVVPNSGWNKAHYI